MPSTTNEERVLELFAKVQEVAIRGPGYSADDWKEFEMAMRREGTRVPRTHAALVIDPDCGLELLFPDGDGGPVNEQVLMLGILAKLLGDDRTTWNQLRQEFIEVMEKSSRAAG